MSTDKKLTIVARYNEDICWTEKLPGDVVIYNKGKDFPWDTPRVDVENFGRESESYVRGILEFYEKLPEYDSVVFLQGDPFHHSKKLFDKLDCNSLQQCLLAQFESSGCVTNRLQKVCKV